jgi:hypothetical protein
MLSSPVEFAGHNCLIILQKSSSLTKSGARVILHYEKRNARPQEGYYYEQTGNAWKMY